MRYRIPFNKPFMAGKELYYGEYTRRCEAFLERQTGVARVLLTPTCTAALELASMLCGIKEGDEVILPSYTFVSTANAFLLSGASPGSWMFGRIRLTRSEGCGHAFDRD